ncbi:hypothetical protein FRC07_014542, partial [Ceratobasidium sp. 392]
MSTPIPIQRPATDDFDHSVSSSPPLRRHRNSEYGTSPLQSSPTFTFQGPPAGVRQKVLKPFATEELRLLLVENISQEAVGAFKDLGFQVDFHKKAFSEAELLDSIGKYHAIGIRSKTKLTARVLKAATKLLVIGCFCIGTNQVDLDTAARAGIPVFNSPFSNS